MYCDLLCLSHHFVGKTQFSYLFYLYGLSCWFETQRAITSLICHMVWVMKAISCSITQLLSLWAYTCQSKTCNDTSFRLNCGMSYYYFFLFCFNFSESEVKLWWFMQVQKNCHLWAERLSSSGASESGFFCFNFFFSFLDKLEHLCVSACSESPQWIIHHSLVDMSVWGAARRLSSTHSRCVLGTVWGCLQSTEGILSQF